MSDDRLNRIEAVLEQFATASNERMSRVEESLAASNERMSRVEESLAASNERMSRVEKSLAASNERMSRVEESFAASNERMTSLERDIGNLRASISDLRDIIVGHERRVIRLEGRDVDLWGDYITLAERINVLEDWKRQQEENRLSNEN
ncbi:hypothetical protein [Coleofasciculus sp. E1-EBD-02]|uniref:hypothetical protein n=1 Tax=Coleofasciculus sp. E1-EBD-02 TaxID=3068481 RepID=UPI003300268A